MQRTIGSGPKRLIGGLIAVALLLGGFGIFFDDVQAASSVTPQSGPRGNNVVGTHKGESRQLATMLFQVDLNSSPSFMFCIDISTVIEFGVSYDERSWDTSNVPNLANISRILSQTNATETLDPVEIAAAQSAIWHFSDGFELAVNDPANDPAVVARYQALVADATANPTPAEPAGTLEVSPKTASAASGQPIFFDVATTSDSPITIEPSDPAVHPHPANGDVCDTATTIWTLTTERRFCLTSTDPRDGVTVALRTGSAEVHAGRVFIHPGRQKLVIAKAGTAQSTDVITVTWTTNAPPTVSIACPDGGIVYGQPLVFTATAVDPDGDPLTYVWSVNGAPVAGANAATATITLNRGDKVSVAVADSSQHSASADATCTGANPPTVTVSCPKDFRFGADATFSAAGDDPDGGQLTYTWRRNGEALTSSTGPTITLALQRGDVLTVAVMDETGLLSPEAAAPCTGGEPNRAPSVSMSCPDGIVFGTPTVFTAAGADADEDPLTFRWSINGVAVDGQNGPTASLVIHAGDTVSVVANDGTLDSPAIDVTCDGTEANRPPSVTISCPDDMVWDEPFDFVANGADPDGDELTFTWTVNGIVVDGVTGPKARLTLHEGDVLATTVTDADGAVSAPATGDCGGNHRPTVTLTCPDNLVFGEPSVFTATASDADADDTLTLSWSVDGTVVDGQAGASASLTVERGQKVEVRVVDHAGADAAATSTCTGTARPTVALTCPDTFAFGEPTVFEATGADADDESLTYSWTVNGTPVDGETDASATLTLDADDVVTVAATDPTGTASATVTSTCTGHPRPTVTLTCPADFEPGKPSTFTATASVADGSTLAYTWAVGDTVVEGRNGASAELTVTNGQSVSVNALSTNGLVSSTVAITCTKTSTGTETKGKEQTRTIPSTPTVLADKAANAVRTATGVAGYTSLPVTGGTVALLAMVGIGAIAAGALTLFARRRRA